jgi:hypothetical protein
MRKVMLFIPTLFLVACGGNNETHQTSQVKPSKEVAKVTKPKKVDLCKISEKLLPKGNHTVVYKAKFEGACRIVAFYPNGTEKLKSREWYPLTVYLGEDRKPHIVYGVHLVNGTLYEPPEERIAIEEFKEQYWQKLMEKSLKMLKDFKVLEIIGNGTQTAYFIVFGDEWKTFKNKAKKELKTASEILGLKIKVVAPKPDSPIAFNFKLPFHQVFIVKDGKVIKTKVYIDFNKWVNEQTPTIRK